MIPLGEKLRVFPLDLLTADLRAELIANKPAVLALLIQDPDAVAAAVEFLAAARNYALADVLRLVEADELPLLADPAVVGILLDVLDRERGAVPPSHTEQATCHRCGPVLLPPGGPRELSSCPWCFVTPRAHP